MKNNKIFLVISIILISILAILGFFILDKSHVSREEFGIYLLESDELVISDKDILLYNKSSHEIKLTGEGCEKIKALKVPVSGKSFVVKLNSVKIYNGSFWTSISSLSYSGIVINTLIQNNSIKIELGYPTSQFYIGIDLRNQPEIFDHFQKNGKLTQ